MSMKTWSVGLNESPRKDENAEGEFEVRMTFDSPNEAKGWLKRLWDQDADDEPLGSSDPIPTPLVWKE